MSRGMRHGLSTGSYMNFERESRIDFKNWNHGSKGRQAGDCLSKGNPHMKSRLDDENDFDKMSLNPKEPRAGTSQNFYNRTPAPEKVRIENGKIYPKSELRNKKYENGKKYKISEQRRRKLKILDNDSQRSKKLGRKEQQPHFESQPNSKRPRSTILLNGFKSETLRQIHTPSLKREFPEENQTENEINRREDEIINNYTAIIERIMDYGFDEFHVEVNMVMVKNFYQVKKRGFLNGSLNIGDTVRLFEEWLISNRIK
jgi:hypothetical protein